MKRSRGFNFRACFSAAISPRKLCPLPTLRKRSPESIREGDDFSEPRPLGSGLHDGSSRSLTVAARKIRFPKSHSVDNFIERIFNDSRCSRSLQEWYDIADDRLFENCVHI